METIEAQEQINAMSRMGDAAPIFEALTTQGNINFPADYKGKWVIQFKVKILQK